MINVDFENVVYYEWKLDYRVCTAADTVLRKPNVSGKYFERFLVLCLSSLSRTLNVALFVENFTRYFSCSCFQLNDGREFTMSDKKAFIIDFIELYKSYSCLWKVKSAEYSDRNKKNSAYESLRQKLSEVDDNASIELVKKKVDNLRGCFRKELKKIKCSKTSGAGAEEVYHPRLWYFEHLLFLADQETPRESTSNIESSHSFDESVSKIYTLSMNHGKPSNKMTKICCF